MSNVRPSTSGPSLPANLADPDAVADLIMNEARAPADSYWRGDLDINTTDEGLVEKIAKLSPSRFIRTREDLLAELKFRRETLLGLSQNAAAKLLRMPRYHLIETGATGDMLSNDVAKICKLFAIRFNHLAYSRSPLASGDQIKSDFVSRLASIGMIPQDVEESSGHSLREIIDVIKRGNELPPTIRAFLVDHMHMRLRPLPREVSGLTPAELYAIEEEQRAEWRATYEEMAVFTGVPAYTLKNLGGGRIKQGEGQCERLAAALGISVIREINASPPDFSTRVFFFDEELIDAIRSLHTYYGNSLDKTAQAAHIDGHTLGYILKMTPADFATVGDPRTRATIVKVAGFFGLKIAGIRDLAPVMIEPELSPDAESAAQNLVLQTIDVFSERMKNLWITPRELAFAIKQENGNCVTISNIERLLNKDLSWAYKTCLERVMAYFKIEMNYAALFTEIILPDDTPPKELCEIVASRLEVCPASQNKMRELTGFDRNQISGLIKRRYPNLVLNRKIRNLVGVALTSDKLQFKPLWVSRFEDFPGQVSQRLSLTGLDRPRLAAYYHVDEREMAKVQNSRSALYSPLTAILAPWLEIYCETFLLFLNEQTPELAAKIWQQLAAQNLMPPGYFPPLGLAGLPSDIAPIMSRREELLRRQEAGKALSADESDFLKNSGGDKFVFGNTDYGRERAYYLFSLGDTYSAALYIAATQKIMVNLRNNRMDATFAFLTGYNQWIKTSFQVWSAFDDFHSGKAESLTIPGRSTPFQMDRNRLDGDLDAILKIRHAARAPITSASSPASPFGKNRHSFSGRDNGGLLELPSLGEPSPFLMTQTEPPPLPIIASEPASFFPTDDVQIGPAFSVMQSGLFMQPPVLGVH